MAAQHKRSWKLRKYNVHDFTGFMFEIEVKPLFKQGNTAHYAKKFLFPIIIEKSLNPFRQRQNIRFASRPCVTHTTSIRLL